LSANKKTDENIILELLEIIKLKGHEKKTVGHYSAGMKRRLLLACSLVTNSGLLLMDEPFTGIDPVSQKIMAEIIKAEIRPNSDINLVKDICSDFIIVKEGRMICGTNNKNELEKIEDIYFKYAED
jgi:ABC-2 type transport system ATP-binding protein